MPRLYVLGSGGWVPTPQRQTDCYLLETRRSLIFFDCGTGLSRLHDPLFQHVLGRHSRALILASSCEQPRIEGLHYAPLFLSDLELAVALPGPGITGLPAGEVLRRYGDPPLLERPFTAWSETFRRGFHVVDLEAGRNDVLGEEVVVMPQHAGTPGAGFRVRDVVHIAGAGPRAETAEFARGAGLLLHEAWLDDQGALEDRAEAALHGSATAAARLAAEAGVEQLVLGHLNPRYGPARLDRMLVEACGTFRRTILGVDMLCLDVQPAGSHDAGDHEEPPGAVEAEAEAEGSHELPAAGGPPPDAPPEEAPVLPDAPERPEGTGGA